MKFNGFSEFDGNITLNNGSEIKKLKVENYVGLPTFSLSEEGRFVYNTSDKFLYYNNGVQWTKVGGSSSIGSNTLLIITDIVPTTTGVGQVFDKSYDSSGQVLLTCKSSTSNVRVNFVTMTGGSNTYVPIVSINGTNATLSTTSVYGQFSGYANIVMSSTGAVTVSHADGSFSSVSLTLAAGPTISNAVIQGYPSTQTEVKSGDVLNIVVTANQNIHAIEFLDSGVANTGTVQTVGSPSTSVTVPFTIANRGDTQQTFAVNLRARNVDGSWGTAVLTSVFGSIDGVTTLKLNNLYPTVTISGITYPSTQLALKNSETATVANTASNYNTISYNAVGTDLLVTSPSTYATSKVVTRNGGSYNVETNNLSIVATRTANNAVTTVSTVVKIANVAPIISASVPFARLRSTSSYLVTLSSNQQMLGSMQASAPEGTFTGSWTVVNSQTSTRSLSVADSDEKGTYDFVLVSATNIAGIPTTTLGTSSYTLGGFLRRVLTVPAMSHEVAIGTQVTDTSKLLCTNLSKTSTSGLDNCLYQSSMTPAVDRFTITDPSETLNSTGNLWYNCDEANVVSNTGGMMQIELEETV